MDPRRRIEFKDRIKIHCGIGDLILYKSQLDQWMQLQNIDKIYLSFDTILQEKFRPKWNNFIREFTDLLFNDDRYVFTDDQSYQRITPAQLYQNFNLKPKLYDISYICKHEKPLSIQNQYVVITTRVRYMSRTVMNDVYGPLKKHIEQQNIVLMGERIKRNDLCNRFHKNIYTIYPALKKIFPRSVDITIEDIDPPLLSRFLQDCQTMHHSKSIICLGSGGNVILAGCLSKAVGFYQNNVDGLMDCISEGTHITNSLPMFIKSLEQINYN